MRTAKAAWAAFNTKYGGAGSRAIAIVAVFAGLGVMFLAASKAETLGAHAEAELGNIMGNAAAVDEATASNGKSVRFGNGPAATVAEEFVGPFSSWGNVKTRYGAAGNGTTDDTDALQAALDEVGENGKPYVVYLPAGTYRITRQLNLVSKKGVGIIGENAANTKIIWDGPAGGNMLVTDASAYIRYGHITWDGADKAAVGVAHWYKDPWKDFASTVHEHSDEVYMNMQKCLVSGKTGTGYNEMDSEVAVFRERFEHCSVAAVSTESFNALDIWVWDSEFNDNGRGVTNVFGAGNFSVYRSVFRRSTVADIVVKNTEFFGIRNNVSVGSKQFLYGENMGENTGYFTLQGNRVIDTTDDAAIDIGNMGPLMLIDNQFRSRSGNSGPVARVDSGVSGCALVSVGNRYTVNGATGTTCPSPRVLTREDSVVPQASVDASVPVLPKSVRANRQVFEVPAGANAATIQGVINQAAASGDARPVVHFPAATYNITQSLVLPANRAIQLVGDSMMFSILSWTGTGAGPVLQLNGPTKATLRELTVNGGNSKAQGIVVNNANQTGARVYSEFSYFTDAATSEITFNNVPNAKGEFHGLVNLYTKGSGKVLRVNGGSDVAVYGGEYGIEAGGTMYEVTGGGKLLLADSWYEGAGERQVTLSDSGTFTMQGAHIAPADSNHNGSATEPSIVVNGWQGTAAFLNIFFDLEDSLNGVSVEQLPAGSHAYFLGLTSLKPNWYTQQSVSGTAGLAMGYTNADWSGAQAIPNVGAAIDANALGTALAHTRSKTAGSPTSLPAGVTDFRAYRIQVEYTTNGLNITQ